MLLAKRNIFRIPQIALGTRKKEEDHRERESFLSHTDPVTLKVYSKDTSNLDPTRNCNLGGSFLKSPTGRR